MGKKANTRFVILAGPAIEKTFFHPLCTRKKQAVTCALTHMQKQDYRYVCYIEKKLRILQCSA